MTETNAVSRKRRILSGMRPTGKLHLGHYTGALSNWIKLQFEFENYFLIADYHVLTTNPDSSKIEQDSLDMLIDWLAAGIDPNRSPVFRQSQIKEHAELFLIFSMLITTSRLERNPTLKDQVRDLNLQAIAYGYLGYPVLQAADILLYKGEVVPVGEDQVPHIEITREIARRFNTVYAPVFPEPDPKLTKISRLIGLDGDSKMSKSLGNSILLSDTPDAVFAKLRKAITDPQKLRKGDPGNPDVCLVFSYHKAFNLERTEELAAGCRSGALGCVDCKKECSAKISELLAPILEKRSYYEQNLDTVKDILSDGEKRAKAIAVQTMDEVRKVMAIG